MHSTDFADWTFGSFEFFLNLVTLTKEETCHFSRGPSLDRKSLVLFVRRVSQGSLCWLRFFYPSHKMKRIEFLNVCGDFELL